MKALFPKEKIFEVVRKHDGNPYCVCNELFGRSDRTEMCWLQQQAYKWPELKPLLKNAKNCPEYIDLMAKSTGKRYLKKDELIAYAKRVDGNPYKICDHFFGSHTSADLTYLSNRCGLEPDVAAAVGKAKDYPEFLEIQEAAFEIQKQTNLEKYGTELYFNSDDFKTKQTEWLQEHGVENVMQIEEIKNKNRTSCLKNNGFECAITDSTILEETRRKNQELYGCDYYMQSQDFREKSKESNFKKYGVYYTTQRGYPDWLKPATYDDDFLLSLIDGVKGFGELCAKYGEENAWHINQILERLDQGFISYRGYKNSSGVRIISYGEARIEQFLEQNNIEFKKQVSFSDLLSDANCKLRFDFGIFKNNQLIFLLEYDGIQHSRPIKLFGGMPAFELQQKYDTRKNEYCRANGLNLERISYQHYEELETVVNNLLIVYNIIEKREV